MYEKTFPAWLNAGWLRVGYVVYEVMDAQRWNMDSALASAARVSLRRSLYSTGATATVDSRHRRRGFDYRFDVAGLGIRSYTKEFCPRRLGTLRVHTQSALPWQLHFRAGFHDWRWTLAIGRAVRRPVFGHLFPGHARRIGH